LLYFLFLSFLRIRFIADFFFQAIKYLGMLAIYPYGSVPFCLRALLNQAKIQGMQSFQCPAALASAESFRDYTRGASPLNPLNNTLSAS
jgi:hypothetical protein